MVDVYDCQEGCHPFADSCEEYRKVTKAPCGFRPPPEGSVETHKRACKLCENIELKEKLGKAVSVLSELASFEYKGGGYYRKKGVPKLETAEVLHGSQVQQRVEEVLEELDD